MCTILISGMCRGVRYDTMATPLRIQGEWFLTGRTGPTPHITNSQKTRTKKQEMSYKTSTVALYSPPQILAMYLPSCGESSILAGAYCTCSFTRLPAGKANVSWRLASYSLQVHSAGIYELGLRKRDSRCLVVPFSVVRGGQVKSLGACLLRAPPRDNFDTDALLLL